VLQQRWTRQVDGLHLTQSRALASGCVGQAQTEIWTEQAECRPIGEPRQRRSDAEARRSLGIPEALTSPTPPPVRLAISSVDDPGLWTGETAAITGTAPLPAGSHSYV
jgi:hypothetical protein